MQGLDGERWSFCTGICPKQNCMKVLYKHVVKSYCTIPARRCLTTKQGIVRGRGGTVRNIWRHLSLRSGQSHIPEHLYIFVVLFTSILLVLFPLFLYIYFYLVKGGHLSLYTISTLFKPLLLALVLPCIGSPSAQLWFCHTFSIAPLPHNSIQITNV